MRENEVLRPKVHPDGDVDLIHVAAGVPVALRFPCVQAAEECANVLLHRFPGLFQEIKTAAQGAEVGKDHEFTREVRSIIVAAKERWLCPECHGVCFAPGEDFAYETLCPVCGGEGWATPPAGADREEDRE